MKRTARRTWPSRRSLIAVIAVGAFATMLMSLGRVASVAQRPGERQERARSAAIERVERALIAAEESLEQGQPEAAQKSLAEAEQELAKLTATGNEARSDPGIRELEARLERIRRQLPAGAPPATAPTRDRRVPTAPAGSGGVGLAASPSPRFQVDQFSSGQSQYRGPQTNRLKWRLPIRNGASAGSAALDAAGTIYFGDSQSNFYAVDPDGKVRWTFHLPPAPPPTIGRFSGRRLPPEEQQEWRRLGLGGQIMNAPAIAADGTIYFGVSEGTTGQALYALAPDGTQKWSFKTDADIVSSPNIASDGVIFFVTADFTLHAVNPDGTRRWRFALEKSRERTTWSNPAIGADGTVYVVGGRLYAIGPDGRQKWAYADASLASAFAAHPTVGPDGVIYVAAQRSLMAIRPDGQLKWRQVIGWTESSPALSSDGVLYVGTGTVQGQAAAVFAVAAADGATKWTFPIKTAVDSSPVLGADGTIYVGTDDGLLYALTATGKVQWQFFLGNKGEVDTTPVIGADGTLYFSTLVGDSQGLAFFAIADS